MLIDDDRFYIEETTADPDGSDRGGFHQETNEITVKGTKLTYRQEVSDYYEERIGGLPEPLMTSKAETLKFLDGVEAGLERQLSRLAKLREMVEATTEFEAVYPAKDKG